MAKETPKDPSAVFLDWVTQWERNFDSFANRLMGTEGFSQAMNETQKAQLKMQGMFTQFMAEQLANVNMPTRDDVLRLGESIAAVDRRLERIEEKLALDTKKKSSKKRPARTKKPPVSQDSNVTAQASARAPAADKAPAARPDKQPAADKAPAARPDKQPAAGKASAAGKAPAASAVDKAPSPIKEKDQ